MVLRGWDFCSDPADLLHPAGSPPAHVIVCCAKSLQWRWFATTTFSSSSDSCRQTFLLFGFCFLMARFLSPYTLSLPSSNSYFLLNVLVLWGSLSLLFPVSDWGFFTHTSWDISTALFSFSLMLSLRASSKQTFSFSVHFSLLHTSLFLLFSQV